MIIIIKVFGGGVLRHTRFWGGGRGVLAEFGRVGKSERGILMVFSSFL